jgi:hypothetical protein
LMIGYFIGILSFHRIWLDGKLPRAQCWICGLEEGKST